VKQRLNYYQQSPELANKLNDLSIALQKSSIDQTLRDLIHIRVSQINGCAFCLDMHTKEAKIHGERELRVYHTSVWRESPLFTDREKAAFAWAEAVTELAPQGVSDDVFDRMRSHFSEKEVADLTFVVGTINIWNRLAISFQSVPGSADKAFGLEKAGLT
jgi:AhpD family alkylhydroperoxidase